MRTASKHQSQRVKAATDLTDDRSEELRTTNRSHPEHTPGQAAKALRVACQRIPVAAARRMQLAASRATPATKRCLGPPTRLQRRMILTGQDAGQRAPASPRRSATTLAARRAATGSDSAAPNPHRRSRVRAAHRMAQPASIAPRRHCCRQSHDLLEGNGREKRADLQRATRRVQHAKQKNTGAQTATGPLPQIGRSGNYRAWR